MVFLQLPFKRFDYDLNCHCFVGVTFLTVTSVFVKLKGKLNELAVSMKENKFKAALFAAFLQYYMYNDPSQ